MKIDDMDIRMFGAKQLTVEITPPGTQVRVELPDGTLVPTETETYTPLSEVAVGVLFRGESRNEIQKSASEFNAALQRGRVLTLDGYERKFMAYMQGNTLNKTISKKRYMADFKFVGYWFGEEIQLKFKRTHEAVFETVGNRDTPCKVTIIALEYINKLTINGFSDVITVENIDRGKEIVVDGKMGTVTEDGANKFADVELWEFPYLKTGTQKKQHLIFSSDKIMVTVSYFPMWL